MLNIHDLEIRHRKYKLKSYIPYAVVLSSLVTVAFVVYAFQQNTQNSSSLSVVSDTKNQKTNEIKKEKIVVVKENNTTIKKEEKPTLVASKEIIKKEKTSLSPSMNFMKKIESNRISNYNNNSHVVKSAPTKTRKIVTQIKETTIDDNIVETPPAKEPKETVEKKSTKISIKKDDQDIQHVIKRFKINNNPALSLFVAKKYYKIGEYHKAYNYALITNEINNDIEDSWIVFAKSLVKLNEKDMAIKTLKKYIDTSHSSQAKILLDEILSGKFK